MFITGLPHRDSELRLPQTIFRYPVLVPFDFLFSIDTQISVKMSEKTNGTYTTNGAESHAVTGSAPASKSSGSVFGVGPSFKEQPEKPPKANREGITKAFSQLAQWVHASESPFPTQTGHGTFSVGKGPGFKQDLKALTKKGMNTCPSQGLETY